MFTLDIILPVIFVVLMGISLFAYVILDGYDLGVGMLLPFASDEEKDKMIASIGPFWDANETWLVLSVGILLVAFPAAHGLILTSLYIPTFIMLTGLIIRGVAFEFRVKVHELFKPLWNNLFFLGSLIASSAQGYMLGIYIMGFDKFLVNILFGIICALCLIGAYVLFGACWLILKTEKDLQLKAIKWAKYVLSWAIFGMILVSVVTPIIDHDIFEKWFLSKFTIFLFIIPLLAAFLFFKLRQILDRMPFENHKKDFIPILLCMAIVLTGLLGLGYSFFPNIVQGTHKMTIWQAASSNSSLLIILVGALLVVPAILAYTIYVYRIFWGKVDKLEYY